MQILGNSFSFSRSLTRTTCVARPPFNVVPNHFFCGPVLLVLHPPKFSLFLLGPLLALMWRPFLRERQLEVFASVLP